MSTLALSWRPEPRLRILQETTRHQVSHFATLVPLWDSCGSACVQVHVQLERVQQTLYRSVIRD